MDFKHLIVAVVCLGIGYYAAKQGWLAKVTGG